jgi:Na+/H+ antiporter NhaD/arsenite permease-like protein
LTTWLLFVLFGLALLGIAVAHRLALWFAVAGLCSVVVVRGMTGFDFAHHFGAEWPGFLNLAGLLLGFALLAGHFEASGLPRRLTEVMPPGRLGAFLLLALVGLLSAVLDNIAAALIGGAAALHLFGGKVHVGYLAAIVAASNAGGAGSVLGDTTTTMMWLDRIPPGQVAKAALGALAALLVFGAVAADQQHRLQPLRRTGERVPVDGVQLLIVALILVAAIAANLACGYPALGVWIAILVGSRFRRPAWQLIPRAASGALFLLCLVVAASMMPVDRLPDASPLTAFGLGIVSSFFDNIPLTELALKQGGYDWGFLAFAVGFGGSMLWFGSSAGVAMANMFPEAKSVGTWLRSGWHVVLAYVAGFLAMLMVLGWHVDPPAGR